MKCVFKIALIIMYDPVCHLYDNGQLLQKWCCIAIEHSSREGNRWNNYVHDISGRHIDVKDAESPDMIM